MIEIRSYARTVVPTRETLVISCIILIGWLTATATDVLISSSNAPDGIAHSALLTALYHLESSLGLFAFFATYTTPLLLLMALESKLRYRVWYAFLGSITVVVPIKTIQLILRPIMSDIRYMKYFDAGAIEYQSYIVSGIAEGIIGGIGMTAYFSVSVMLPFAAVLWVTQYGRN